MSPQEPGARTRVPTAARPLAFMQEKASRLPRLALRADLGRGPRPHCQGCVREPVFSREAHSHLRLLIFGFIVWF